MGPAQIGKFYLAEPEHQGYLRKNPGGYCNHDPNGVTCPVGVIGQAEAPSEHRVLGRE